MGPCMGQIPDTMRASVGSEEMAVRARRAEEEAMSRFRVERKDVQMNWRSVWKWKGGGREGRQREVQ